MFWFVLAIILAILGLAAAVLAGAFKPTEEERSQYRDPSGVIRFCGIAAVAVALIVLGFDSTTTVTARTVGVETSFGHPVGALSNGFHFVRPWASIDDSWDGTVQTDNYMPTVRLANGTTANLDVRVQYRIDTGSQFLPLWRQYRDPGSIRTNVIELNTTNALNQVFEQFNPVAAIDANGTQTITVSSFAPQVLSTVRAQMPPGMTIVKIVIPTIAYNATVQQQIDAIVTAAAQTRVAVQNEQTAKATAAGNNALAQGNTSPSVVQLLCLNLTNTWEKDHDPIPPGWTCGVNGAQVVIPATK